LAVAFVDVGLEVLGDVDVVLLSESLDDFVGPVECFGPVDGRFLCVK